MTYLDIALSPRLLAESCRELERERLRHQRIQEARAARRGRQTSRFATLARRGRTLEPHPCRPLVDGC